MEGIVELIIHITASGTIQKIEVAEKGELHPLLVKATQEAAQKVQREWRTQAVPTALVVTIPVRYALQ